MTLLDQTNLPATDAVWRLQTHWTLAPWLTVVLIAAAVGLVAYCYARESTAAGAWYRGVLGALRLATVTLILVMLSELLLAGTRTGRPRFGWVIDLSGSMTTVDYQSGQPAEERESRLDKVKQALLADDARLLNEVAKQYDARIVAVGDGVKTVDIGEGGAAPAVEGLAANQQWMTRLGQGVNRLLSDSAGPPPQAIAVLTDGRNTAGPSLASAAESARRVGTPLFLIGVGSAQSPPDIALSDPLADEVVFVDDLLSLGATLRVEGGLKEPVRLALRREGDPKVIAQQTIDPASAGDTSHVQLLDRPTAPGDYRYVIEAAPADGERDLSNNSVTFDVQVRDARVRVLLAAGYPMYEFRYLKNLLERDSTVELKTYLQEADLEFVEADQTAINRFPLRLSELDKFDVVVLMDLDPRLLPRAMWGKLSRFVESEGGGVVMVAGPRSFPGAYRGLDDFLALAPTQLETAPITSRLIPEAFQVRPTKLGMRTAPFQLGDNRSQSESIWRALAPLYWCAEVGQPKPAAQVLAEHPTALGSNGRPLPLVVSQYYGAGQVTLHALDASYLWRKRAGDAYFARYWVQTLRRLAHGRLRRDDRGWELAVERGEYQRGEVVRVRLSTPGGAARQAAVLLAPEGGPQRRIELAPSAVRPGVLEADLEDLPVGKYRVLLSGADAAAVSAAFEVVNPPGEFARLEMDASALRAAAQRSGGRFLTIDQAGDLLDVLPVAQRAPIESLPPVELWNRWWMLAGVCGCLVTEWILRKRKAML